MKLKDILKEIQLKEGKQVGTLYHYTNLDNLRKILDKNYIGGTIEMYLDDGELIGEDPILSRDFWVDPDTGETKYFVSTSRNSRMFQGGKPTNFTLGAKKEIVRIKLDGDKLSNRYKIISFDHPGGDESEEEERILCPKGSKIIKDIGQYIEEVALYTNSISVEDIIDFLDDMVPTNKIKNSKHDKSEEDWEWSELKGDYGYEDDEDDDDDEDNDNDISDKLYFNNWIMPSTKDLKFEFKVEHEFKDLNVFKSEKSFLEAAKKAKVITIDKNDDLSIENRSRTRTKEQLMDLISGYRSYPEFRNEDTVDAIYDGFKENKKMVMPIILYYKNKKNILMGIRVFSGNTRMDVAFQLGTKVRALVIKSPVLWNRDDEDEF